MYRIPLIGKLDTQTVQTERVRINQLLTDVACDEDVVMDAENLSYISSSGLRLILELKKKFANLTVINLNNDVFDVFEMTGFSRILNVKKKLRTVSVKNCKEIGRGGVGVIYRIDDDTIIKVFEPECDVNLVERERIMAKESFVLGMPTAIPYDLVKVEETNSYGLVFELITAGTMSAVIKANPHRVEHYAEMFGRQLRRMHSIKVETDLLPDSKQTHFEDLERIAKHFSKEEVELMHRIISLLPEGNSLLHNDCHPKNMMLDANEQPILIDMGEVGKGHPLIELGHTYSSLHIEEDFEAFIGFPKELGEPFWHAALKAYLDTDDESVVARYDEMISVVGNLRSIMWIAVSDFPDDIIAKVRKYADEKFLPRMDFLLSVAEHFNEF